MQTITIPKNIAKNDDLVVVRRREYEKLFKFWMSAEQLTARQKLAVEKGLSEIEKGNFFTSGQVRHELGL
ncbi:MAG: hypothetical protein AAB930_03700 [Patescibacteria group bacterium]